MIDPVSSIVATTAVVNQLIILLNTLAALLGKVGVVAASVVSVSSLVAKYVHPPVGESRWSTVYKIVNALAQNAGYAENKEVK